MMTFKCVRQRSRLTVQVVSWRASRGRVALGQQSYACALGRSGCRVRKREGDGCSPVGDWSVVRVLYRRDRVPRPRTALPVSSITPHAGWCDAPSDRNYNRAVPLPYPVSAEALWRDDGVYDIVVVLDHNSKPRRRDGGSAIFLHLARPGYPPTEGCIALSMRDLRAVLVHMTPKSRISIGAA